MKEVNFMEYFNKDKKLEKEFVLWLDTTLEKSILENIKVLAFKIQIYNNNVNVSLIGSSKFSTNFDFKNNFVDISDESFVYDTIMIYKEREIKKFIEKYLKDGKYSDEIKKCDYISMIFSNGIVDILYLNDNIENNLNECEKIKLSKILDVNSIMHEYKLEELLDYSIGYDNEIHLMFVKNNKFLIMTVLLDWTEYRIIKKEIIETSIEVERYYNGFSRYSLIRSVKNNYLLVSPRLENQSSTTESNALLVSKEGKTINSMCLGDDTENKVITTDDGKIIVAYGDEGVYGNNLLSRNGLNVFDDAGRLLTKNPDYLVDETTINISDKSDKLYFYNNEFSLVITNIKENSFVKGINKYSVTIDFDNENLINDRAYFYNLSANFLINNNKEIYLLCFPSIYIFNKLKYAMKCKIDETSKKIIQESFFVVTNQSNFKTVGYNIRGSKLLALGDDNILYGYEFN